MKLKVPIEKIPVAGSQYRGAGWNACLDEVSQCEFAVDHEKLVEILWKLEKGDTAPQRDKLMLMKECYMRADAMIFYLPSILTIKRKQDEST